MKPIFTIILLLTSTIVLGQSLEAEEYEIYSDFLTEYVINEKRQRQIIEKLVIEDSTHSNITVDQFVINFNSRLFNMIEEDSIWYSMLNRFNVGIEEKKIANNFNLPVTVKLISSKQVDKILNRNGKNWKWKRFYRKFPDSSGIITFSPIIYNSSKDKLAFYYTSSSNHFSGGGYIILMEKENEKWIIKSWVEIWVS